MKIELNDDALEFGAVVRDALGAAGGDELIQRAEADPAGRDDLVGGPLGELGVWELDVRGSEDELEAAAAVCRSVGWWAAPGSVAERLARPTDIDADALTVVAGPRPAAPVHDSSLRWVATDLDGNRSSVTAKPLGTTPRKAAFVADLDLAPIDDGGPSGGDDVLFGLLLPCWTLLGMLDRTVDLTVEYVTDRQQFGRPLSKFQSVQFQLTEAEVERVGFAELAKYTTWSVATRSEAALDDVLALRLAAIDAAELVFRICHQLHGAIGFCDETTISWISRYSQTIRRLPLPASGTRSELTRRIRRRGLVGLYSVSAANGDLDAFRAEVRAWCAEHVPADWRERQTGVDDDAFVAFQQEWFQQLRHAGYAVPHWPAEWGGGMSVPEQMVLYQELARADAPRLVLQFVSIHHAASTFLHAGTDEQRQRHLPAILDGEIWCQGFSEPDAGSDLAALKCAAVPTDGGYRVTGQKVWASGALHADWCLLLARTDPEAPKRKGISYFLMDMRSEGIEVRPIEQATGQSHFCEMFLDDVFVPAENLIGAENDGWRVAQSTLGAERGMTMLELSERLAHVGFQWLVDRCHEPNWSGKAPIDDPVVLDRLAGFEAEVTGLRSLCATFVEQAEAGTEAPADASIVKLYYSELLQRLTDFGTEIVGVEGHTVLEKPISSGWESGAWVLDFISSWEWTIPGGSSEIQRNIIGERGLGLPREPRPAGAS